MDTKKFKVEISYSHIKIIVSIELAYGDCQDAEHAFRILYPQFDGLGVYVYEVE